MSAQAASSRTRKPRHPSTLTPNIKERLSLGSLGFGTRSRSCDPIGVG